MPAFGGHAFSLAYLGFGLTQVYLAHFNGNMIYLFMVLFFMAAIRGHQRGHGGRNRLGQKAG